MHTVPDVDLNEGDLLRAWARVNCTRPNDASQDPTLLVNYTATHHSRGSSRWMMERAASVFDFSRPGAACPVPVPGATPTGPETIISQFVAQMVGAGAFGGNREGTGVTKQVFTDTEMASLMAFMGISDEDQFDNLRPVFYDKVEREGRTKGSVLQIVRSMAAQSVSVSSPTSLFVSASLGDTFRRMDFGYGGDTSYETCHL